jgi:membrane-associated HD superfamily phosphohydrolase
VLEQQVNELSEQNEKLRTKLDKLLAERPGLSPNHSIVESTPLPEATTEQPKLPEIDLRYFRKVLNNLEAHKYTLLTKEIQLERLHQGEHDMEMHDDELHDLRERLIRNIGNKLLAEAEVKSIEYIIRNLRLEKVSLTKERDTIAREVDARMAVKEINGVGEDEAGSQEDVVEKALLDVKGWIEETLAKWADVSSSTAMVV